ncbi:MAG: hypothetical protein U9Q81_16915 [Pseudomonadota bacterium]|nr:hypothetical protein [Pseudomonadota bacterium]
MSIGRSETRPLTAALFCSLLLLIQGGACARGAPGQISFSALPAGDLVHFRYELPGRDEARHRIRFQVPRLAIERARSRFSAHNPEELRRLAEAEFHDQLLGAVASLRRSYPGARIELEDDHRIAWRVGGPEDFAGEQQRLFDQHMEEELAAIRAEFPQAEIRLSNDGRYSISAPGQDMLDAIQRRMLAAEDRSNGELRRYAQATRSRMETDTERIGQDLRAEVLRIEQRMKAFKSAYFRERLYKVQKDGYLRPDYARIARESLTDLKPVADALTHWIRRLPKREGLTRLLLFTQTIPYERLDDRSTDAGFLMPLIVLAENRGDCDSKSTTYAALAHLMYPDIPIALVLVPRHALLALGLPPAPGDRTLEYGGRRWVLAEPVGPAVHPLGEIGEDSERSVHEVEAVVTLFP